MKPPSWMRLSMRRTDPPIDGHAVVTAGIEEQGRPPASAGEHAPVDGPPHAAAAIRARNEVEALLTRSGTTFGAIGRARVEVATEGEDLSHLARYGETRTAMAAREAHVLDDLAEATAASDAWSAARRTFGGAS